MQSSVFGLGHTCCTPLLQRLCLSHHFILHGTVDVNELQLSSWVMIINGDCEVDGSNISADRRRIWIHQMNRVNSHNPYDSTINTDIAIIIIINTSANNITHINFSLNWRFSVSSASLQRNYRPTGLMLSAIVCDKIAWWPPIALQACSTFDSRNDRRAAFMRLDGSQTTEAVIVSIIRLTVKQLAS